MDITAFLAARLDEREQLARAVQHAVGDQFDALMGALGEAHEPGWRYGIVPLYLRSHDPARVLAEVKAKRKVVTEYATALRQPDAIFAGTERVTGFLLALEMACRALASPYADHPDYNPAWRVE